MGCLRFLGKMVAFLLLIVFLVVLPVTVWTFNIQQTLLERSTYQRLLEKRALYTRVLPAFLPELLQNVESQRDLPPEAKHATRLFTNLTGDDWETVIRLLMPASWVQNQLGDNVDALFDWVEGTNVRPDFQVDLTEFKQLLGGEEGKEAVQLVVESWPVCSEAELEAVLSVLVAGIEEGGYVPFCRPEDAETRELLTEQLGIAVASMADEMPDTFPSDEERSQHMSSGERDQLLAIKFTIRVVRRVSYLIFMFPVTLLLLIEIFAVRSFKSLFRWYGWALVLGGLVCMALPLDVFFLTIWQALSGTGEIEMLLVGAIALNQILGQSIWIQAGGITIAGLVFLIFASLIPASGREKVVEVRGTSGEMVS